jgi:Zn-dependent protease
MKRERNDNAKQPGYSLHWSFLLILVWMVGINIIEWESPSGIIWALLLIAFYLLSLVFHELGHYLAGRMFGYIQSQLLILPSGAIGRKLDERFNLIEKLIIRLAGPATNLLIAAILKLFILPYDAYWNEPANLGVVDSGNFLFQLHLINLGLAVINLFPLMPMDGGSILRDIMSSNPNNKKAYDRVSLITRSIAFISLVVGIFFFQLYLALFGIYILITWKAESRFSSRQQIGRFVIRHNRSHGFRFGTKSIIH